jgi:hypothetical protein
VREDRVKRERGRREKEKKEGGGGREREEGGREKKEQREIFTWKIVILIANGIKQ